MLKHLLLGTIMLSILLAMALPIKANASPPVPREALIEQADQLHSLLGSTNRPQLKQFLESVHDRATSLLGSSEISPEDGRLTQKALEYALKLAEDVHMADDADLLANSPFIVYDVPALSPLPRLPDDVPEDGIISDRISLISAQGEFEAASFVLAPLRDVNSVTFTTYDLQGKEGTIPASAVDLRVVKTWYQGGTAWYSYFSDSSKSVLVPELLLHDENLVQVDTARKGNSLRVDYTTGSQYVDISNIPTMEFDFYSEPVEDSPTLLPITLKQGESKQMWLTTKVPLGTPAGIYKGSIDITADGAPAGRISLHIRVLPFELPDPKTYYDLNKDFYVMLYNHSRLKETLKATDGNTELAETRLLNEYRNMADHNVIHLPGPYYSAADKSTFLRQLELMAQAGLDLDPLFGVKQAYPPYSIYMQYNNYLNAKKAYESNPTDENKQKMDTFYNAWRKGIEDHKVAIAEAFDIAAGAVGHTNLYFDGWDEASWGLLQFQQELWEHIQDKGGKVYATGHASHLELETPENFLNWVGEPTREKADQWHALGGDRLITNYAYPHTGPENPDLMRQRHGMWPYKANYDATYNYIYYENPTNIWNDNASSEFRAFNLVYPTRTNVIDTIAWEGYREGIDDIRYATKLKQVAADAMDSGVQERITAATHALNWLESVDERSTNQDLLRLEMIRHILNMLDLQNGQ
ncbi:hypothetical protein [Paenibacillus sp. J2TS4]|uniref:hypothetical protein n=1 Tax=Paenibacillus sp. J2TS4 TaxID=2807194 RepID=UPI001B2454D6|nr:hypothetical protein [Paenibacillus sp. J2TS4]GIP31770.1 hypothetical protein J2TS4_09800 [Paenibacillus sp. J2TS4]